MATELKLARLREGPEIFFSLQGEGRHVGRPSVFVRTSRCNLQCVWCDTPYTWFWRGHGLTHESGEARAFDRERETLSLSIEAVADEVQRFPCRHVVLTGGEPLLQAAGCAALMRALRERDPGYRFDIETNGTLVPPPELAELVELYTVSPKLESSGMRASLRLRDDALSYFAADARSVFKLVVAGPRDKDEVVALTRAYGIEPDRVYLMPCAADGASAHARARAVAGLCLELGFRYSDRLHLHLFGKERGV